MNTKEVPLSYRLWRGLCQSSQTCGKLEKRTSVSPWTDDSGLPESDRAQSIE